MPDLPRRRRPQRPSWTEPIVARLTPSIRVMVVVDTFVYLLYVFVKPLRPFMEAHLAVGPGFARGELWQPLSALFVHFDLLGFVFNLIGLWFVGALLESVQGTRRFLLLFFASGILSNVTIGLLQLHGGGAIFDGCSLAILALFVALGRIYGRQPMQVLGRLFLQARVLALIFVAWTVIAAAATANWALLAGGLVTTAVGFFGAAPGGLRELYDTLRARRLRRRYRVLDGGASRRARSPKYWN